MAISTKWKSNFSALAVVALMIAVSLVPSANAQDPFEIAVGLGMGAAMSAMDLLSQGAAIRGGSELEVGKSNLKHVIFQCSFLCVYFCRCIGPTA